VHVEIMTHAPHIGHLLLWAALATGPGSVVAQELVAKIGHVAPTSGWMSIVGIESENAARLAVDELNTRALRIDGRSVKFELVAADDLSTADRARAAAQTMVAAQVRGVVGHLTSGSAIAATRIYAEAGIPHLAPAATHPMFTRLSLKTAFRLVADDGAIARLLGRFAVGELKLQRFALIDDRGVYGRGAADAFADAVVAAGGRVVVRQQTTDNAIDFGEFLAAVKAERADAVFFGGFEPPAGRMIRQMKQLGLAAKVLAGDGVCTPDLVSYYARGEALDDQVICVLPGGMPPVGDPATARFAADYMRRYGAEPAYYGPHAYDGVMLIADAMVRARSIEPAAYLPALASTRDIAGASGRIRFDDKGDLQQPTLGAFTYTAERRRLICIVR
jgi:branched-chain amino acid transport system substrate-binding protein